MSVILGRKADKEPYTCCVCGRRAFGIGVSPAVGEPIAWLCDDPECVALGQGVYKMTAKNLDIFEERAVLEAGAKLVDDFAEAVLGSMWKHGIRSLDQLDAEQFPKISADVRDGPEYRRALMKFLSEFATSLKTQLASHNPPF